MKRIPFGVRLAVGVLEVACIVLAAVVLVLATTGRPTRLEQVLLAALAFSWVVMGSFWRRLAWRGR